MLGLVIFGDILGQVRQQDVLLLPCQEMRGIRRIHHVDGMDVAGVFLADALEYALGPGAFDPHLDAGEFVLERGRDLFRDR
jgi:hypothetical protein